MQRLKIFNLLTVTDKRKRSECQLTSFSKYQHRVDSLLQAFVENGCVKTCSGMGVGWNKDTRVCCWMSPGTSVRRHRS